jgi:hypothetical protein
LAPDFKGAWAGKSKSAFAGVGNKGASDQVLMGYTNSIKPIGKSHTQAGRSPKPHIGNVKAKDTGNPAAINPLRHHEFPHKLRPIPSALAKDSAQPTCKPWLIEMRNTAQAAPQAKSAGKGQGGAALNRFKPEGASSDMVRKDRLTMNA